MINLLKPPKELQRGYKDRKHLAKVGMMPCIACETHKAPRATRLEVHHKAGGGMGRKASDLLTIPLCNFHHQSGGIGNAIHSGIEIWEGKFGTQDELILEIHKRLKLNLK